jgi:hypothetical protein
MAPYKLKNYLGYLMLCCSPLVLIGIILWASHEDSIWALGIGISILMGWIWTGVELGTTPE